MNIYRGFVDKKKRLFKTHKLALGHVRCLYCDKEIELGSRCTETMATLDHIIPKSKGGTNNVTNLALSCFNCNQEKGDKQPDKAFVIKYSRLLLQIQERIAKTKSRSPLGLPNSVTNSYGTTLPAIRQITKQKKYNRQNNSWLSAFGWDLWLR